LRKVFCFELRSFLEVPENPMRVVSLTPSITATLIEMGLGKLIVGVSPWCRSLRCLGIDVPSLPVVGSYTGVNEVLLRELEPDLVLISGGYQASKLVEVLRGLGVPFYVARLPRGLEFLEFGVELGYVLNAIPKGFQLLREGLSSLAKAREVAEALGLAGARVVVAMRIGSDLVLPGFASHVVQALEVLGLECPNKSIESSYLWGSEAVSALEKLCAEADAVLYQQPLSEPRIVEDEVSRACGKASVVYLPLLSLSDYSPHFAKRLPRLVQVLSEAVKSRGSKLVATPAQLAP